MSQARPTFFLGHNSPSVDLSSTESHYSQVPTGSPSLYLHRALRLAGPPWAPEPTSRECPSPNAAPGDCSQTASSLGGDYAGRISVFPVSSGFPATICDPPYVEVATYDHHMTCFSTYGDYYHVSVSWTIIFHSTAWSPYFGFTTPGFTLRTLSL